MVINYGLILDYVSQQTKNLRVW